MITHLFILVLNLLNPHLLPPMHRSLARRGLAYSGHENGNGGFDGRGVGGFYVGGV